MTDLFSRDNPCPQEQSLQSWHRGREVTNERHESLGDLSHAGRYERLLERVLLGLELISLGIKLSLLAVDVGDAHVVLGFWFEEFGFFEDFGQRRA